MWEHALLLLTNVFCYRYNEYSLLPTGCNVFQKIQVHMKPSNNREKLLALTSFCTHINKPSKMWCHEALNGTPHCSTHLLSRAAHWTAAAAHVWHTPPRPTWPCLHPQTLWGDKQWRKQKWGDETPPPPKSEILDLKLKMLPQSERHCIEASLHLTEECPRCLHL